MISKIPSIFQVIDSVVLIEKNITARLCTLCGLVIIGILRAVCRDAEWLNPGTLPPFENVFKRNVLLGAGQ